MRNIFYDSQKDKFSNLCVLAEKTLELPEDSLATSSRKQPLVYGRMAVAVIGKTEQNTPFEIMADVLKQDRTSFYHYTKYHKDRYSKDPLYRQYFDAVYKAYKKIDSHLNIFYDSWHLKEFLLRNGVKNNENKKECTIRVTSGDVTTDIHTTYFDHLNQIENIKLALKNYKFKYHYL